MEGREGSGWCGDSWGGGHFLGLGGHSHVISGGLNKIRSRKQRRIPGSRGTSVPSKPGQPKKERRAKSRLRELEKDIGLPELPPIATKERPMVKEGVPRLPRIASSPSGCVLPRIASSPNGL